jgi:hypothetical protein
MVSRIHIKCLEIFVLFDEVFHAFLSIRLPGFKDIVLRALILFLIIELDAEPFHDSLGTYQFLLERVKL